MDLFVDLWFGGGREEGMVENEHDVLWSYLVTLSKHYIVFSVHNCDEMNRTKKKQAILTGGSLTPRIPFPISDGFCIDLVGSFTSHSHG